MGRHPYCVMEAADQRSSAEVGALGEVGDGDPVVEVSLSPLESVGEVLVRVRRHRPSDVLGLAAVSVRGDDHAPGDFVGGRCPEILADQLQAEVDGRRSPCRREDSPSST